MKWQILICTTTDRRSMFDELFHELYLQIVRNELSDEVEILFDEDNREKSVGKKRQDLLEMATAEYISFFDSDDWPFPNYIKDIYTGLTTGRDCVGIKILMTTNGLNQQTCCHSLKYKIWASKVDGYDYIRNVTHFNPVLRELALMAGFQNIRYGEDKDYSDRLTPLCKTEAFIETPIFHYRYSNLENFNKKYGI